MVLYEVNLKIASDVFEEYMSWLKVHVKEMLSFDGFESAKYLTNSEQNDPGFVKVTMQYFVDSLDDLNDYLENHSQKMRSEGTAKFPNKFSASRRIFNVQEEFSPEPTVSSSFSI